MAAAKSKKPSARAGKGTKITVHHSEASARKAKLPKGAVALRTAGNLEIKVARINTQLLRDQRSRMAASDGCISNPGGPSC